MARYSFFVTLLSFVLIFVWFVSMTFVENRFDVSFLLLEIERICQLTKFHQNLAPAIATFIKKARTFHPGVLFQSFSFFRITEKKKEGGKPISSSSTFISFPYEIANHGRSVIACPLSLSLWNDIRLARGQKKSEDKALSSSSDLPEIVRRPSRPYASPDICLNPLWILSKLEFKLSFWRLLRKFWYIYILMSDKWVLIVQNSEEENRIIRLDTIRNEHRQPRNELESFVLNWSSSIQFHGQRDKTRSMRRNCFLVSFLLRKSYVTRARIRLAFVCMERRSKRGAYSSRKRRSRWSAERCANVTRSSGSSARVVIVFSAVAGQSPISRDLVSPWSSGIENENREIREEMLNRRDGIILRLEDSNGKFAMEIFIFVHFFPSRS